MTRVDDMIKVLVVDDDLLVRDALSGLIDRAGDIEVVGGVSSGDEMVEWLKRHPVVNVVLMDVRMPGMDGFEATRAALDSAAGRQGLRVLLMTSFGVEEMFPEAIRSKAHGLLLKSSGGEAIVQAIRTIHQGLAVVSDVALLAADRAAGAKKPARMPRLTEREQEVLALLCEAYSNAEIARALHLSESRVKSHISAILDALEVDSRLKAVLRAFEWGLAPHP